MGSIHPCGAVPVTGITLNVWYCHHHQAFFGHSSSYTEHGIDDIRLHSADSVEFGPFDSSTDMQNWMIGVVEMVDTIGACVDRPDLWEEINRARLQRYAPQTSVE